jgi:hypothetical protein
VAGAAERPGGPGLGMVSALVVMVLVATTPPVARADAGTASPRHEAQLDRTVRFLQEDQNADGGFGGEAGAPSDPDFSAWVALALAAADVNPHSQARPGGADVYSYLAAHAGELTSTTDFERALLVVDASEYPPRPLAGVDLVAKILERRLPSGAFAHEAGSSTPGMNDTIFAILALSPVEEPAVEAIVDAAAEWVIAEQDGDGSWPSWCPKSVCGRGGKDPQDNTDMTGAAIEALNAAGMPGTEAQARALAYLHEVQLPDGGWPQARGEGESNAGSTAWVVQGIWAAGGNPETWRTGAGGASEEPLDYLTSLQQEDGHIRYTRSRDLNGVWMTSYVAPALAGRALPIVPPPPIVAPPMPTPSGPEEGVIAGGGGNGAPNFSRPKAGSKGRTPGGARLVRGQGLRARDHGASGRGANRHGANRRGANRHQPRGTETAEPPARPAADHEVGSVSGDTADAGDPPSATASIPVDGHEGTEAVGGGDRGAPPGTDSPRRERGAPADGARDAGPPGQRPTQADATTAGDEVDGVVVGSPDGRDGTLAFGAPGLKSGRIDGGDEAWPAIGVGAAALLAALAGGGWERRRGAAP